MAYIERRPVQVNRAHYGHRKALGVRATNARGGFSVPKILVGLLAGTVMIGAGIALAEIGSGDPPPSDEIVQQPSSLVCWPGTKSKNSLPLRLVFVFDTSDRWVEEISRQARNMMSVALGCLHPGDSIEINILQGRPSLSKNSSGKIPPVLAAADSHCGPERGRKGFEVLIPLFCGIRPKSHNEANILFENPEMLQKEYDTFTERVYSTLDAVADAPGSPDSPLLSGLCELASVISIGPPARTRLFFYTDLVANDPTVTHFRTGYSWATVKNSASAECMKGLAGSKLSLVQLGYNAQHQTKKLDEFWRDALENSGMELLTRTFIKVAPPAAAGKNPKRRP